MTHRSTGPNLRWDGVLLVLLLLVTGGTAVMWAYFYQTPKSVAEWIAVVLAGPLGSIVTWVLIGLGAAAVRVFRRISGS